jgi:hypothetical protein
MESTKPFKIRNDLNLKSDGVGEELVMQPAAKRLRRYGITASSYP